jgi:hypothetical protein
MTAAKKSEKSRQSSTIEARSTKGNEKEYLEFFQGSLFLASLVFWFIISLILFKDTELGKLLAFTEEEVDALAPPLASILSKQKLDPRIRKVILSSKDGLALVALATLYVDRVNGTIKEYYERNPRPTKKNIPNKRGGSGAAPNIQPTGSNGHISGAIGAVNFDYVGANGE